MTHRILIMGLPGAGKTTLARELITTLSEYDKTVEWFNADRVREQFNDWDFSHEGRIRQSERMRTLADKSAADFVISDFVAPLPEMRTNYAADTTIWVDTIPEGRFADTNRAFVQPDSYDFRVTEQDAVRWANLLAPAIMVRKCADCDNLACPRKKQLQHI